jgi:predicted hotdog family 3-hydroxylacyl-ACP dehydratase
MNKTLNHDEIAARIPHAGTMCLLDTVRHWDADSIVCTAVSHHSALNPLRVAQTLPALTLVEYAAQAMAVHGSLLQAQSNAPPQQGRLVSVRQVELFTDDLSMHLQPLELRCQLLLGDASSSTFSFAAQCNGVLLGQGRASVMLVNA